MRRRADTTKTAPDYRCVVLGVFVALAIAAGCERAPSVYHITGPTMGTVYSVKVLPQEPGEDRGEELARVIQEQLDSVNAKMSTYRDDSELSRFNQSTSTDPFPVSEDTFHVFQLAHEISAATNGAFDVTVGPLVNAWGFGPDGYAITPPSPEKLEALHQRVGYAKIELNPETMTIQKRQADLYADLSAIAKGYGTDKVFEAIHALGFENFMVEVGGEVRAIGHNDRGQPWQIAIEKPISEGRAVERVVALDGLSLATSGDYRNYVERDGIRMSHLIDPRTNRPIAHNLASASVLHKECAVADGYATAMMVLGLEEGYETAVREELAVMFIVRNDDGTFAEKATPAFDRLMPADGQ
jgi:thiamine biosynthesis lipoprotein